ncbi:hypothetical protein C8R44DRAFT_744276 [Mycena epipterygia]|nr:hypothetical protein C8R44DRAFT_744276 [Mycena epipterygia]
MPKAPPQPRTTRQPWNRVEKTRVASTSDAFPTQSIPVMPAGGPADHLASVARPAQTPPGPITVMAPFTSLDPWTTYNEWENYLNLDAPLGVGSPDSFLSADLDYISPTPQMSSLFDPSMVLGAENQWAMGGDYAGLSGDYIQPDEDSPIHPHAGTIAPAPSPVSEATLSTPSSTGESLDTASTPSSRFKFVPAVAPLFEVPTQKMKKNKSKKEEDPKPLPEEDPRYIHFNSDAEGRLSDTRWSTSMQNCIAGAAAEMEDAYAEVLGPATALGSEIRFELVWPGYPDLEWNVAIPTRASTDRPLMRHELACLLADQYRQFMESCKNANNPVFGREHKWCVGPGGITFDRLYLAGLWHRDRVWYASVRVREDY